MSPVPNPSPLATRRAGRIALLLLLVAMAVAGLTWWRMGGPAATRRSVQAEGYLAYPGAVEVRRVWSPETHARGIDALGDLSSPAELFVHYAFPAGTRVSERQLRDWYDAELTARGWRPCVVNDPNGFNGCKQVGRRRHRISIAFAPAADGYQLSYTIGFFD